jgi:RluA family pseudouridine synthase
MLPSQRYGRFPFAFCRLLSVATCIMCFSTRTIPIPHPPHSRFGDVTTFEPFDYTALPPIADSASSGDLLLGMDFPSDEDLSRLPVGDQGGFCVVRHYAVPNDGFGGICQLNDGHANGASHADIQRLQLTSHNVTLPVALVLLDNHTYPTLTRAKKACRRGAILIRRHPKADHAAGTELSKFSDCPRGKVGDRVFPGDVIGYQMLLGNSKKKRTYPNIEYCRPSFQLPVVYEDDHIAVINKPAGISVYGKRQSRSGSMSRRTVRDALPYALTPPVPGAAAPGGVLKRPVAVHRLDGHTSGLLLVAKTKVALDSLHKQFEERKIQKIYTAVVNGKLSSGDHSTSSLETTARLDPVWNFIDYPLGGKSAFTSWRILREAPSLNAKDGVLSMVELRPRTGRYHQLRRHMAWICRRPLVGDPLYAGALQAHHFRRRGLFLCSNAVAFRHPVYTNNIADTEKLGGEEFRICQDGTTIEVTVSLELPKKFSKLLDGEEQWASQCAKQ